MVAEHWDCPSLGTNSRYMLFSLASSNVGTSKCELRGLSQLWFGIFFLYWVVGRVCMGAVAFFNNQDGDSPEARDSPPPGCKPPGRKPC